jgi:hypothetical protein
MFKKVQKVAQRNWHYILLVLILVGFTFIGLLFSKPRPVYKEYFYNSNPPKWTVALIYGADSASFNTIYNNVISYFNDLKDDSSPDKDVKQCLNYTEFDLTKSTSAIYGISNPNYLILLKPHPVNANDYLRVEDKSYTPDANDLNNLVKDSESTEYKNASNKIKGDIQNFIRSCRNAYKNQKPAESVPAHGQWKCVKGRTFPIRISADNKMECMTVSGVTCWEGKCTGGSKESDFYEYINEKKDTVYTCKDDDVNSINHWCNTASQDYTNTPPSSIPSVQPLMVDLYEACSYDTRWNSTRKGIGRYNINDMGVANDSISSIKVPAGLKITVYQYGNFSGISETFTGPINLDCLWHNKMSNGVPWNDQISSFVIEKA